MLSDLEPRSATPFGFELIQKAMTDHYELLEEIGRGGTSAVYKAIQRNLSRPVALKVIHQSLLHDQEFATRFHREARVSASLSHPNIIRVYDEGEVSGVHFISMEYLLGNSLHEIIIKNKQLSIKQAWDYLFPVAKALDYLHAQGKIHSNIKPTKIFITTGNRPVLLDPGISWIEKYRKDSGKATTDDTPNYLSPEQIIGSTIDYRTDVYSLGLVFYECITGFSPFKTDNPHASLRKIVHEPLVRPATINPEISQGLEYCMLKSLEKEPNKRYRTTIDFFSDLFYHLHENNLCSESERPQVGQMDGINLVKIALSDRYKVLRLINQNYFKERRPPIFEAVDKIHNIPVAIKIRDDFLANIPEFYQLVCSEASTWKNFDHPNIIKVYEEGTLGGVYFLATEYLSGKSLKTIIQEEGALSTQSALKILLPVIKATQYIHDQGTFHRYIVSENILITDNGQSILLDFGISHALDKYCEVYHEKLQSKFIHYYVPSDMVGWGIILLECITGHQWSGNLVELNTFFDSQFDHGQIPSQINEIVLKAISIDKNHQYLKLSEMIIDLERLVV